MLQSRQQGLVYSSRHPGRFPSMRRGRVATFVSDLSMRILRSHPHHLNTESTSKLSEDGRQKIEKNKQITQAPIMPSLQRKDDHRVLGY
ncbi:hypothetical protein SNOG_01154 [Parastagonospora nodorum SN15]|uniref:Uncharacterized protein n=2 Tax=Phaeosphaeria nodorum (strain SN15 / ATCC MYA-4574 / FGSC 10173) TaxID=321614 RepID=Q0V4B0_PHANO|nr:hypothetical protein SNOG_01154 [Parastagonospora nodorum SN15]EAT90803.1 hypothetical protein SNOG_01154 [Parastagonospora nodorum SN15]